MVSRLSTFITNVFKASPAPSKVTEDVGYILSPLYAGSNIPTYNPDELMAKRGNTIYDQMMRDEQIKAVYRFRRDAVTARNWEFSFEEDQVKEIGEKEAEKRIDVFTKIVYKMKGSFKKKLDGIMSAMAYGFSMTNKVYDLVEINGEQWMGIKHLRTKPPFTFYFYLDEYGNMIKLSQEVNGRSSQDLDINRFIHYARNSDVDEYYGRSELVEAYRAWFSKEVTGRYMNMHMERCGSGFNILKPTGDGKTPAKGSSAHNDLMNVLDSLRNTSGIVLPANMELESVMPKGVDVFKTCLEYHDLSIAKAMLVPNLLGLSVQGNTGSFAQSSTQLEAFLWMLDADAVELEEVLNEQLFKELGELNFGDGLYPYFCLLPLSESQTIETIKVWKDLVTSGAVEPTDTDESRIREMLGMPEKGESIKPPPPVMQPGVDPLTGEPINNGDPNAKDGKGGTDPTKKDPKSGVQNNEEEFTEETIRGKKAVAIEYLRKHGVEVVDKKEKFSAATKRVDFAAIAKGTELIEVKHKHDLSAAMDALVKFSDASIREDNVVNVEDITKLKFPADLVKNLRRVSKLVLLDGWNLGEEQAAKEVRTATMRRMPEANYAALRNKAAKYLDAKSFLMAGNLSDEALSIIKTVLVNSVKYSKGVDETMTEIYTQFAKKGMISPVLAKEALGEALDVEDSDYRLRTVIRTNSFDAINEARFDFYSDPDLKNYVQGLEYSAVLDGRTTDICAELDGHTHATDWEGWDEFRPPNHFNCRSILVPLLPNDEWEDSGWPSVSPQEGFS